MLSVAGVVRPRDIATDNTISYDKIAEARISYGGRGRITEVQQPGWGQQLYDLISAVLTMASASDHGRRAPEAEPAAEPVAREAVVDAGLHRRDAGPDRAGASASAGSRACSSLSSDGGRRRRARPKHAPRRAPGSAKGRYRRQRQPEGARADRHQPRQPRTHLDPARSVCSSMDEQTAGRERARRRRSPRTSSPSCAPSRSRRSRAPSGFQHLREDLNDRVRVRSGGKVRDLVIQSMIIE